MMEPLKIICAGSGPGLPTTRRAHLQHIAGLPLLSHVLGFFDRLPAVMPREFILPIDPDDVETPAFLRNTHPALRAHFVQRTGAADPVPDLFAACRRLAGPMLIASPDTLVDADLSFLQGSRGTSVAWVRHTADPVRGSFAVTDADGRISRIRATPPGNGERRSLVGMYYLPDGRLLADILDQHYNPDLPLTLDELVNLLLNAGLRMRPEPVAAWLDGSSPAGLLEMNAYLLENGRENTTTMAAADGVSVFAPSYVDPSADIDGSIIGPNVSIGPGCRIEGSALRDCIIGEGTRISGCQLEDSIVGRHANVHGVSGIIIVGEGAVITAGTENRR